MRRTHILFFVIGLAVSIIAVGGVATLVQVMTHENARLTEVHAEAEAGNAEAQAIIGAFYTEGYGGLPQDYSEAIYWLRLSADQGNALGQAGLAFIYSNGLGVLQDYEEALYWNRLAADQGQADAQYNLGVAYYNGEGVPRDVVLAYTWYNLAAAQDIEEARENRDKLARIMSFEQINEAQRRSKEIQAKITSKAN